jgi:hypothetical protein
MREVLRLWLHDETGERAITRLSLVDRKTVKRCAVGVKVGPVRNGDASQLTDEVISQGV